MTSISPYNALADGEYTVGLIAALNIETIAMRAMLDDYHGRPSEKSEGDNNTYELGRIGNHNVVIAQLDRYGTVAAALTAKQMTLTFRSIKAVLMVGIGGGIPNLEKGRDIRLGDVVVSKPTWTSTGFIGGVLQHDLGRILPDGKFQRTSYLNEPPESLIKALHAVEIDDEFNPTSTEITEFLRDMIARYPSLAKRTPKRSAYVYADVDDEKVDCLFPTEYQHLAGELNCASCDRQQAIFRPDRETTDPVVHYGLIASGNTVVMDGIFRDKFAEDCLCFEMEAAGLMKNFPCLVIRGISDYSDSHKNSQWQPYAAATAAAYAKKLVRVMAASDVAQTRPVAEALRADLEQIKNHTAKISARVDKEEELGMLTWLTPVGYDTEQNSFIRRQQPGTGQWFLESDEFQAWLKTNKMTLFCPGIPGAGKTIITAIVIHYLQSKFRDDHSTGIAYIYCNFRRQDEQTAEDLLASLLKQLSQKWSTLSDTLKELYDRHKSERTRPSFEEISRALQSVVATYSRVFIIVDALDECQTSHRTRSKFLSEIFSLQAKTGINFFATSRPILDIEKEFSNQSCETLEILAIDEDVRRYVDDHMSHLPEFVLKRQDLQEEIRTEIIRAIDGMFLLAHLYLNSLEDKTSARELKCALKELRKQGQGRTVEDQKLDMLTQAYKHAVERIDGQKLGLRCLARKVISWITFAKRPLTTSELQEALALNPDDEELDEENYRGTDIIVSVCAGLVTVDVESCIIRLVHYTAQEYFERAQNDWLVAAEDDITTTCITYLSFKTFETGFCQTDDEFEKRLLSNQLYDYATHYWGHHARGALACSQLVVQFLEKTAQVEASTQASMVVKKSTSRPGYSQKFPRQITGLHLAAYFGVHEALNALLGRYPLDLEDSYGRTSLSWGAWNGHEAVTKLLLEKGADIESKDKEYGRTPLSWAVGNGQEAAVKLLLENNANAESKSNCGRTPLSYAAGSGREIIVKLLLEKGTDLESKDIEHGQAPLSFAARYGHRAVVKMLLDLGADLESKALSGRTPLSFAAGHGNEAVAKLLLENGAKLEFKDKRYGRTPLSWAAWNGQAAVLKLLLEKGANLESKDLKYGRTPLSWAAGYGREEVVRLLLEKRANLEPSDGGYGRTPLSWAVGNGHEAVVKLLLKNGADLESRDTDYFRSPLAWAAWNGHTAIVQLLIDNGADLESESDSGRTPLSWAAGHGHEAVVKLLLEYGASSESMDKMRTPLSYAVGYGRISVVKLLLEKGAKTESGDKYGRTPLGYAAGHGQVSIVKLLLENGANLEVKDENYNRTPLSWAAGHGNEGIVKLLLEKGADPESECVSGRTPLSYAAGYGREAVIKLFLENGVNLESKCNSGRTPLSHAAKYGRLAVATLLLKNGANLESKCNLGWTPLSYSAENGHKDVVSFLLGQGAELNYKDTSS